MAKVTTVEGSYRAAVVIPVYNALSQTARCLRSVMRHRDESTLIVVVNDGSDIDTTAFLRTLKTEPNLILIEQPVNVGFCKSANRGLQTARSEAPFVILLNSDTIVSEGWIDAFEDCFGKDEKIGLATAISNNADNLSVRIPAGMNYRSVAQYFSQRRQVQYPDITTAIGFCMGIRSSVLDTVGLFDESFGRGYGEDSDYHYRVITAGLRSVLVSNCFVYHDDHASFGSDRAVQVASNAPAFEQRWKTIHDRNRADTEERDPMAGIQAALDAEGKRVRHHDICFILPSWVLAGGIVVVYELTNRLIERGVDANVIIVAEEQKIDMDLLFQPYFIPHEAWRSEIPHARLYVATRYDTAPYASLARMRHIDAQLAYLVQGYEGWFAGAHLADVVSTYRAIPHRVTVSNWLQNMLERWDIDAECIPNGVDTQFFTPPADRIERSRRAVDLRFMTMLRDDPQGGWRTSFEIIRRLKASHPHVQIIGVGDLVTHPEISGLLDEHHTSASRREMREIYRRTDIFLDSSIVQGFGLMGLEAMACGVSVVLSATGGVREYATEENAAFCQIGNVDSAVGAIRKLIDQPVLRERLAREGRKTAERFDWDPVVQRYENYFRSIIDGHPAFDLYAVCEMLLTMFLHSKDSQIAQNVGAEILRRELQSLSGPRGADEAFAAMDRNDVFERLQDSYDGQQFLRFYDAARNAFLSAERGQVPSESSKSLLDRVIGILQ